MRQVELDDVQIHFADLVTEAEAGQSLTILRAGRAVARMIPLHDVHAEPFSKEERQAARKKLRELTATGYDLGVVWNGRDELYDRD